ncbi:MAG: hypothetical protein MI757_18670 [Pirellulales bacterium]|nr:hypothetical protein [Pirellulales bacterium]
MSDHHQHHHSKKHGSKSAGGKNTLFVVAVVLMLVGMVIYVLTMDEEIRPGGEPGEKVPAEASE